MPQSVFFRSALTACLFLISGFVAMEAQQGAPDQSKPGQKPAPKAETKAADLNLGLPPLPPQAASPQQKGDSLIRIPTEVVTFTVTVTDLNHRLVIGLDRQNFEVYEDKIRQTIEYFKDEDGPASIGIVFDLSGSMKSKVDRAREALKAFIQTSHDDDDFFLVGFNQRAELLAEFTDGEALLRKLTLVESRGQTALYDATYLGLEKVPQGRHPRRALLLISDGQDNSSRYTYGELRKRLKEANVQIYCLGIVELGGSAGSSLDLQGQAMLEEIAQVTGGKAFFPRSAAELEDATTRIALELRHQYSIGYLPTNVKRDGRWRQIKVRVNPPRGWSTLTVRTKEGYYAVP